MKLNMKLLTALAGVALCSAANAQVNVTIGGSTAIRGLLYDRVVSLFSPAPTISSNSANFVTFSGSVTGVAGTTVIRCSGSGSSEGLDALVSGAFQPTCVNGLTTLETNRALDICLSDIFSESAYPVSFDSGNFDVSKLCVIPFVFMKNSTAGSLTGVTNLTRDQALALFTTSSSNFPQSFYGGTTTNKAVLLVGRNPLSGTRITIDKDTGFTASPRYWMTNSTGGLTNGPGYDSGAKVRDTVRNYVNTIGYLGGVQSDITSATTTLLTYDGVPFAPANVINGSYPLWGYEQILNNAGVLDPNQTTVRDNLIAAFANATFTSSALFTNSAVKLSDMQVQRATDGATITP
jgi:hypothetical protein